jgi:hypothetical protein
MTFFLIKDYSKSTSIFNSFLSMLVSIFNFGIVLGAVVTIAFIVGSPMFGGFDTLR